MSSAADPSALAINGGPPAASARIPYGKQDISEADIAAVVDCLRSPLLTTGPKVAEFETAFAKYVGAPFAVAVANGTAALHCAAVAAGLGPGDEAIVSTLTFASTANCVLFTGATPVFADILPATLNIDPASVEAKITPRTKAVFAVDYGGQPCDYVALRAICDKHHLVLVADASHSYGATLHGRPVGALADLSTFSFHPVKNLCTGEGGMIIAHSEEHHAKLKLFRSHGITSDPFERARKGMHHYEMVSLGYNYRITDIQCALGLSQLTRLDEFIARRQQISAFYRAALADLAPKVTCVDDAPGTTNAHHLFVIQVNKEELGVPRDTVFEALRAENVGVNVHYPLVHLHPYYRETLGTGAGDCPVAEDKYARIISFPMYASMTDEEAQQCVDALKKVVAFYSK